MKTTSQLFIVVFTLLTLTASADAQFPREQLQQMVEQLQKTPSDQALRERAIALAAEFKPTPVVPEDARRAFIRGNTAFAAAKDPAGFSRAIERFEEASALAPWWADPYFNLAKACEGAQDFDRALRALTYYRATATTEADRRQALDLTYALEEKRDLKKTDAASASAVAAKQAVLTEQAKRFEGDWYRVAVNAVGDGAHLTLTIRRNAGDVWRIDATEYSQVNNVRDIQLAGPELRFKYDLGLRHPDRIEVAANIQAVATVTADGSTLRIVTTPMPFTPNQVAHWKEWSNYTPKSGVTEYKR
jgi:hypothetical protein